MNFGFTEEQELLRAEVRKFLDQNCPLDEVRKLSESPEGFSRPLWNRMAELGWVGLTFPETYGGVGLGWVDLVVVLEETGRTLFPSPLLSTVLAGAALVRAGSAEQREAWLPQLAAGTALGALAVQEGADADPAAIALEGRPDAGGFSLTGEKRLVMDALAADFYLVAFRAPEGPTLALVPRDAAGLTVEAHETVDLTRRMGRLRFDGVSVPGAALLGGPGQAGALLDWLFDCGATAVTAEMIGAAEGALALTVGYAKQRIQFGEPIGRFQGVKHPLAEAYVDIESFRSLCYWAAWQLDQDPDAAALPASRAKALASETFPRIGIETVGLHGGIGYTWEYDAHLFLKRAKWSRPMFGDADWHYERIFRLAGEED
ncbi:MAG: acyl-CoA dehydrogenase family protein [Myxococcota bacterium]|nr:acyl-CoA dehydrogenase family protein [Myxococcota bacterium]